MDQPLTIPAVLDQQSSANLVQFIKKFTAPSSGEADRSLVASASIQVIPHGLNRIPSFVRISGFSGSGTTAIQTVGTFDGENMSYSSLYGATPSWGTAFICQFTSGASSTQATLTFDKKNINISWTITSGGVSGTLHFIWEAL